MKNYLVTFISDFQVEAESREEAWELAADDFLSGGSYSSYEIEEI